MLDVNMTVDILYERAYKYKNRRRLYARCKYDNCKQHSG